MIPFFSIVIPVFNGISNGLDRCLDSIWSQPIDSSLYEVICVDDCSSDNSRAWLESQLSLHTNLRVVFNQQNIRQGGSRNVGIKSALGRYIVFIDQDDYYHPDAIARAYDHLKKSSLEVLIVDCAYQFFGRESNVLQHNFPHLEVMSGDDMILRNSIPYAPWKFIIDRHLITDNGLFFAENERIEDVDWVHRIVHYAHRVQYQPILFIHYNKTEVSTTMTSHKTAITTYSTLRLAIRLKDMVDAEFSSSDEAVRSSVLRLARSFCHLGIRNYFFFSDDVSAKALALKTLHVQFSDVSGLSLLARSAMSSPSLFSILTNCLSPLMRMALHTYRRIKYHA